MAESQKSNVQSPVKQNWVSEHVGQLAGGLLLVIWGIYTNLKQISPDIQAYGLLFIFFVLMAFLVITKYTDVKREEKKWIIDAEVEKQKSWNESARSPIEVERASIESMAKHWNVTITYGHIISMFEEWAKDETRPKEERTFCAEAIKRLKDMQRGASVP